MEIKRAAIYARFSSDMQRSESIDAQVRACKYYAQRFDLEVVRVYADAAKTGRTTKKRDEFAAMMLAARDGDFDVLLVHKLNRFSRKGTDTLNNKEALEAMGVELVSVTERLDNSPEGRLMLYVITGMNEFYSANLAAETMKGLRENAYNGMHTGGLPPLGYDVDRDSKRLVLNEAETGAVRTIFSMYLAGKGYGEIVDVLNSRGLRTKRGAPFGRNSIHDILLNEKYTGLLTYDKIASRTPDGKMNRRKFKDDYLKIEGGCPQIISREDFERVRLTMERNRHSPRPATVEQYLLSGKLFCGECGARMCGERHKVRDTAYAYYVCNEGKRRKNHRLAVPKQVVEDMVFDALSDMAFGEGGIEAIARAAVASYEQDGHAEERILAEMTQNDREIANLVRAVATGLDEPEIREELARLKQRKAELNALRESLRDEKDQRKSLEQWRDYLRGFCNIKNAPDEDKKALIQAYVGRVLVFQNRGNGPEGPGGDKVRTRFKIEIELNPNGVEGREGNGLPLPAYPQISVFRNGFVVLKRERQ